MIFNYSSLELKDFLFYSLIPLVEHFHPLKTHREELIIKNVLRVNTLVAIPLNANIRIASASLRH